MVEVKQITKRKVSRAGRALVIVIPPSLAKLVEISPGDTVNVYLIRIDNKEYIAYAKN
ncbi:MAG: hypothetical protein QXR02_06670 [Acidilobaceae archaeon]